MDCTTVKKVVLKLQAVEVIDLTTNKIFTFSSIIGCESHDETDTNLHKPYRIEHR
jgi:hypothetical protein